MSSRNAPSTKRVGRSYQVGQQIFPSTVGRPPVAPATFVTNPTTESFAIMAMAIASFASLAL